MDSLNDWRSMGQRLGLIAFWKNYDRETYLKAAKLADVLGYDSFFISEAWGYDCTTLLAEMAVKTRRIKLGSGIINVFTRSPALIAMQAASLQDISDGRFMLGIGTSAKPVIEGLHGREFTRPLTQMRDVIRVVRGLHSGERLHEVGAIIDDYRPFKLAMDTPITPEVPIFQASLKQKSITSIGEMADGWMPIFWPYDRFDEGRQWIAEGAAKSNRSPSDIVTAPYTTVIPLPGKAAQKQAKDILAMYVGGMGPFYKQLLSGFGWKDECEEIAERYGDKDTRDEAWEAVTDEMVEKLFIAGDPLHCRRELRRRIEDFGMDYPMINLPPNRSWPELAAFLIALAPTRWP